MNVAVSEPLGANTIGEPFRVTEGSFTDTFVSVSFPMLFIENVYVMVCPTTAGSDMLELSAVLVNAMAGFGDGGCIVITLEHPSGQQ